MKKTLSLANGIALLVTIIINYLSNTGVFGGNTMKAISDKYANYFTPAGYAFSIWGLIYLGLLGFVIYTWRAINKTNPQVNIVSKISWWFVISCMANCLWVVSWLNDLIGISLIIMAVLLFSLLKIIINTRMELDFHPFKKYLFIFWPFAIYAGWVSVAVIANAAAWLTKINWNGWGISAINWAIIMISVAGLINVFMVFKRNLREYALAGIWGLIAVASANTGEVSSIPVTCYIVAAVIFISILINGYKNKKASFERM